MKKIIYAIIVFVVIVGGYFLLNKKQDASSNQLIKIGSIESLTGVAEYYGQANKKGVELALEEMKKKYPELKMEVYHEDSLYTAKGGLDAYNNLQTRYNLDAVITHASPVSIAIQPLAKQANILQMGVSASAKSYGSPDDLSFRMSPTSDSEAEVMAEFIKNRKFKKLGLIYMNNDFGVSVISSLENSFKNGVPVEIIGKEGFVLETTDFRTILGKLKKSNPDGIFVVATANHLTNILKQAKELGIEVQFMGPRSSEDPTLLKNAKDVAEGFVYTYGFDPASVNNQTEKFVAAYEDKYKVKPDGYAAEGYEGMRLIADSFAKCGKDYDCIKNYLSNLKDYPSVFGSLLFDNNGDVHYDFFLKTVKNGEFIKYQE